MPIWFKLHISVFSFLYCWMSLLSRINSDKAHLMALQGGGHSRSITVLLRDQRSRVLLYLSFIAYVLCKSKRGSIESIVTTVQHCDCRSKTTSMCCAAVGEGLKKSGYFSWLLPLRGGGAPCFRIGGAEDNFIIYIEYCFFFVPVMKLRWEYNISKQF